MRPLGDRRAHVRFEVVGALFGSLDLTHSAQVIDVSTTGALILSKHSIPVGSHQPLLFKFQGKQVPVSVAVRRVERVEHGGAPEYYVGVEFVSPPEALIGSIGLSTELAGE